MSTGKQLLLWNTGTAEESLILTELTDLKEKQNNLRRGLFQRYDIMKKEIESLKEQLELIKNERRINNLHVGP